MIEIAFFAAIVGFATYRTVWLWRYDSISEPLREWFWTFFPPSPSKGLWLKSKPRRVEFVPLVIDNQTKYAATKGSFIGDATECPWCLSAYVTAGMCGLAWLGGISLVGLNPLGWLVVWLAAWGVCCSLL